VNFTFTFTLLLPVNVVPAPEFKHHIVEEDLLLAVSISLCTVMGHRDTAVPFRSHIHIRSYQILFSVGNRRYSLSGCEFPQYNYNQCVLCMHECVHQVNLFFVQSFSVYFSANMQLPAYSERTNELSH